MRWQRQREFRWAELDPGGRLCRRPANGVGQMAQIGTAPCRTTTSPLREVRPSPRYRSGRLHNFRGGPARASHSVSHSRTITGDRPSAWTQVSSEAEVPLAEAPRHMTRTNTHPRRGHKWARAHGARPFGQWHPPNGPSPKGTGQQHWHQENSRGMGTSSVSRTPPPLYKLRQCTQLLQSLHLLYLGQGRGLRTTHTTADTHMRRPHVLNLAIQDLWDASD